MFMLLMWHRHCTACCCALDSWYSWLTRILLFNILLLIQLWKIKIGYRQGNGPPTTLQDPQTEEVCFWSFGICFWLFSCVFVHYFSVFWSIGVYFWNCFVFFKLTYFQTRNMNSDFVQRLWPKAPKFHFVQYFCLWPNNCRSNHIPISLSYNLCFVLIRKC